MSQTIIGTDLLNNSNNYWELVRRYKQLQQENKQLKEIEKEHQKINGELRKENKALKEQLKELYRHLNTSNMGEEEWLEYAINYNLEQLEKRCMDE